MKHVKEKSLLACKADLICCCIYARKFLFGRQRNVKVKKNSLTEEIHVDASPQEIIELIKESLLLSFQVYNAVSLPRLLIPQLVINCKFLSYFVLSLYLVLVNDQNKKTRKPRENPVF